MIRDSLLSNIDNKDRELIIKAAELSGFSNIVYIEDVATYGDNIILENHFGLHTMTKQIDHSKFWRKFDKLKKGGKRWKDTNLNLTKNVSTVEDTLHSKKTNVLFEPFMLRENFPRGRIFSS